MKEYKIQIRVKNNLILEKMNKKGVSSVAELSRILNISPPTLFNLINMKKSAIKLLDGEWRDIVIRLCDFFVCTPEELFTERQKYAHGISKKEYFVAEAEVNYYLEKMEENTLSLENRADQESLKQKVLPEVLSTLTPRERKVIECRFIDDMTLEKTGNIFNVNRERIRQIEARALRKLRHESRLDKLKEFINQ